MVRDWLPLYRLSLAIGLRNAVFGRRDWRETAIRVLVPIEVDRYLEFSETLNALGARPGEKILDLASPKLLAVHLAKRGAEVTSLDYLPSEVETWSRLSARYPGAKFEQGDGRSLPYADDSFDHAYSVSVLEHIAEPGDEQALAELARVVRPGGRIVLTLPQGTEYSEDWRDNPVYRPEDGATQRHFFARSYDAPRLDRLFAAAPSLDVVERRSFDYRPSRFIAFYRRFLPWSSLLSPLVPFFLTPEEQRVGPILRVTLRRR